MKGRRPAILIAVASLAVLVTSGAFFHREIIAWVRFVRAFESIGFNANGFQEYRHRKTGIVFVKLPGGTFWIGAQKSDPQGQNYDPDAEDTEGPVQQVLLRPFLIGKYEVTQHQWMKLMSHNPSDSKGGATLPVDNVSLSNCLDFCIATGLEMPGESQWEYACRAGIPEFSVGDLEDLGWYVDNSKHTSHSVGTKKPNYFGIYDMYGNVWEWCRSKSDMNILSVAGPLEEKSSFDIGTIQAFMKGGCWKTNASGCRPTYRQTVKERSNYPTAAGFRPAYQLP